eukprot:9378508-Pyramimonas_sp.AAC.1
MINDMMSSILDTGSNINSIGVETAQTLEQVSRPHGHAINRLNLTKRPYVSGAGHGAAICDKSLHCKIECKERGEPVGQRAAPRLDAHSAHVAECSGGASLPFGPEEPFHHEGHPGP